MFSAVVQRLINSKASGYTVEKDSMLKNGVQVILAPTATDGERVTVSCILQCINGSKVYATNYGFLVTN